MMRGRTAATTLLVLLLVSSRIHAQTIDVTTRIADSTIREAVALASQPAASVDREWQAKYNRAVAHRNAGEKEVALGLAAMFAGAFLTWTDSHKPPAWPLLTFSGGAVTTWGAIDWCKAKTELKTLLLHREQHQP